MSKLVPKNQQKNITFLYFIFYLSKYLRNDEVKFGNNPMERISSQNKQNHTLSLTEKENKSTMELNITKQTKHNYLTKEKK